MSNRRVLITETYQSDEKIIANVQGLANEEMASELYQLHGFASSPEENSESILLEINGDTDNYLTLPPSEPKEIEQGQTLIYYGDTEIILTEDSIKINVDNHYLNIENGKLETDLDIETKGDIKAKGDIVAGRISLKRHQHIAPSSGGMTSTPK